MNCEPMEAQLIAYLDGRAGREERRAVERHLAGCGACRARVAEFRRVWELLDEYPASELSPYFDARLRQRLAAEPRPSWWRQWMPQPRLVLATAALLLLGIWVSSFPPNPQPLPPATQSEEEFRMIKDLPVLENYDVLADFDALSEVPGD